jgi:hypothetical protein
MKTPLYTRFLFTNETVAAANKIPTGVVNEHSHKFGMSESEPIIIMLDCLLQYAQAYHDRYDGPLKQDQILGDHWLEAIRNIHGLLNGDGVVAMRRNISTDTKDNGACEAVYWEAIRVAGFTEADLN